MVKLKLMEVADFTAYQERAIREYAADHVRNGDWDPAEAEDRSRKEHEHLLPQGVNTPNQFVWSIQTEAGEKIGVIWIHVKPEAARRRAFIYDFIIEPTHRGKGFGKATLRAVDEQLRSMNVESVALHVFAHNTNALELYKKTGFEITDLHMRKLYGQD